MSEHPRESVSWKVARWLAWPGRWFSRRAAGSAPPSWSPPSITVADPYGAAADRFRAEMRSAGTILGASVGAALAAPGGYNPQPVAVVVVDSDSGLIVVDHRFAGSPQNAGASADLEAINAALASMTVAEFCDAYQVPYGPPS